VRDASRLGPEERRLALRRMAEETFDVAIVGGGVTGCGAALDAATRGLSVALLEKRDLAAGTSSRSSKLIHGGLRYLEKLQLGLVREALREQTLLLGRICPHLVRPVPFLVPLARRGLDRAYLGAGVLLYDLLAWPRALPRHRHLSRRRCLELFPGLRAEGLAGGIQYWDAQVDDARHTLTLARTAALHGAALATSLRAVGFLERAGRVCGVRARCLETGAEFEVRARQVINAAGVWTERVRDLAGRGELRVRASKGVHVLVPRERIPSQTGLIARTATSVLLLIPWKEHWIVGTTDSDWGLDLDHPAASRRDIEYLLGALNEHLAEPLSRRDVVGVYAGLRPLLYGESDATSELSREHAVSISDAGLISVAGGKYTTYRVMARDAVDAAASRLPGSVPPSCTDRLPLLGADGWAGWCQRREALARASGWPASRIDLLLGRYGSRIAELLELAAGQPELGEPLEGAEGYLRVEALYAAASEGALHLDDVLTRRTRISVETRDRGVRAAGPVCELMAGVLGWDAATRAREIAHYQARVAAERDSQEQPDDRTADAARLGAPDVRTAGERAPRPAPQPAQAERRPA
jgi:glycerol-3-phosphate dehydrogenase